MQMSQFFISVFCEKNAYFTFKCYCKTTKCFYCFVCVAKLYNYWNAGKQKSLIFGLSNIFSLHFASMTKFRKVIFPPWLLCDAPKHQLVTSLPRQYQGKKGGKDRQEEGRLANSNSNWQPNRGEQYTQLHKERNGNVTQVQKNQGKADIQNREKNKGRSRKRHTRKGMQNKIRHNKPGNK